MKRMNLQSPTPALARQVTNLELQLIERRAKVRNDMLAIKHKVTKQKLTPGFLLAAVGVGFALEQGSHHKAWSLPVLLEAANTSLGLILAINPSDSA